MTIDSPERTDGQPKKPERWVALAAHRRWLWREADDLWRFFEAGSIDPAGGFFQLDAAGRPVANPGREIHSTTRMVHCFAAASLLGRPGADDFVDHGMASLWSKHRDARHGGYMWSVSADGPVDDRKQAYGHAFVLLAASSALVAGHGDAGRLLDDIETVLAERFWEDAHGAVAEEFARDWSVISDYRGQNANMHLTEALMAAFEATGRGGFLTMAEQIAALIVNRHARDCGWRVAEHFDANWQVDRGYRGNPVFRPSGTTPGHAFEWVRLLVQLWELGGRRLDWLPEAARQLFELAVRDGWNREAGGIYYTLDWDDRPLIANRYWWPCCEAIGAAHALGEIDGEAEQEARYRTFWNFTARHFIDRGHGGWHPQLDASGAPATDPFTGKPDLYHALQACLIPLYPVKGSITRMILAEADTETGGRAGFSA